MGQFTDATWTIEQVQVYDNYDRAVMDFLHDTVLYLRSDNQLVPIPKVFATPERAFALMARQLGIPSPKNVPLPFGSLQYIGETFNWERNNSNDIRYGGLNYDNSEMTRYPFPRPYIFTYQFRIYGRNRRDLFRFKEQIIKQFDGCNEVFLQVYHPEGFGLRSVPITLSGIDDVSQLETGEKQRELEMDFTFEVKGWYAKDSEQVNTALKLTLETYANADCSLDLDEEIQNPDPDDADDELTIIDVTDNPNLDRDIPGPGDC